MGTITTENESVQRFSCPQLPLIPNRKVQFHLRLKMKNLETSFPNTMTGARSVSPLYSLQAPGQPLDTIKGWTKSQETQLYSILNQVASCNIHIGLLLEYFSFTCQSDMYLCLGLLPFCCCYNPGRRKNGLYFQRDLHYSSAVVGLFLYMLLLNLSLCHLK